GAPIYIRDRKKREDIARHLAQAVWRDHISGEWRTGITPVRQLVRRPRIVDHDKVAIGIERVREIAGALACGWQQELTSLSGVRAVALEGGPEEGAALHDRTTETASI